MAQDHARIKYIECLAAQDHSKTKDSTVYFGSIEEFPGNASTESPSARVTQMTDFPGNSLQAFIPNTDSWVSIQG